MSKGGDVIFRVGRGSDHVGDGSAARKVHMDPGGNFVWQLSDGTEMLRINDDGDVYVRGDRCERDTGLVAAFREWLSNATVEQPAVDRFEIAGKEPK